jgi:hypothetical protein
LERQASGVPHSLLQKPSAFRRRSVHADLSGADLTSAILIDANLTGVVPDGAKLDGIILPTDIDDD